MYTPSRTHFQPTHLLVESQHSSHPHHLSCHNEVESVNHLFFTCSNSRKLWSACTNWWGLTWCFSNSAVDFLDSWSGVPYSSLKKKLWFSFYCAVVWSIWKLRNKIIFNNHSPYWNFEVIMLKTNIGYWLKGWCLSSPFSPHSMISGLEEVRWWLRHNKR